VVYRVVLNKGGVVEVDNPSKLPSPNELDHIEEPFIEATIVSPEEYYGAIMSLVKKRRGEQKHMEYLTTSRIKFTFHLPLNEIVLDFFDKLKSSTRGYASMDYEHCGYRESNLVKLDVLVNGNPVDTLSTIIHRDKSMQFGKDIVLRMKNLIPRQMFDVAIQAAIGSKIISRSDVRALRKNVLAKCYGGDVTRKRKLLEKQKEGKKRMKSVGQVEIPQEAFLAMLKAHE
jgi:GTP-binding protein LepA